MSPGFARAIVAAVAVGTLAPPLVAALAAVAGSGWIALLVGLAGAIVAAPRIARRLPEEVPALARAHPLVSCAWALGGAAAVALSVNLSVFLFDPMRSDLSVFPGRGFFRAHSCLSAYTEAARLARDPALNIYEDELYVPGGKDRHLGPFVVDPYLYPPPFLLLPRLAFLATTDFFTLRPVWFAIQVGVLALALLVVARWIGGRAGVLAALAAPLVWLAPPVRLTLQIGNFQVTAIALSMLAMVAHARRRHAGGAALLGFATAAKIFPGVLGAWLLGARRWRAAAATAIAGAAIVALAGWAIGGHVFEDFWTYHLPRIASGDAFFWADAPSLHPVNQSVYGLVTKLRALGLDGATRAVGNALGSVYGALLVAAALVAGHRLHRRAAGSDDSEDARAHTALVWLSLLSLAAWRSPFVPDAYGTLGTLWAITIAAAAGRFRRRWERLGAAALFLAASVVLDGTLPERPAAGVLTWTLAVQLTLFAFNLRLALAPGPAPATLSPEPALVEPAR